MADRLRGALARPWLQALVGIGAGAGLAVWFFVGFGLSQPPPPSQLAPQAAVEAPVASEPAAASTAEPNVEQEQAPAETPQEASPFAAIDEPPPTSAARSGPVTHTVAPDEVLWQIAETYALRSETIVWVNSLDNPDLLLIGQQLIIPPQDGVLYTVQEGDQLADIAQRYGVELPSIVASNQFGDANQLVAGVDIFLPGGRPLARAPSTSGVVEAATDDAEQAAALALPPVPLPANVDALLAAGWLRTQQPTQLFRSGEPASAQLHELPAGARLERLDGFRGGRVQVRDPGDGRTRQAMTGWVNAIDLDVGRAPAARELPLAYPADTAMDISHVFAPYRSQLDGSAYAEANCGPTAVGMALAAFGISVPSSQLRAEALSAQRMWGNGTGTLITALASVVRQHGLSTLDLTDGGATRRWDLDDVRSHVQRGHPVIVQVRYRALPGRGAVRFFGDHYILVTGVVGDSFLYNDPIDFDGIGWDRIMSGDRLRTAMDASDRRYAYAAFAVAR